MDGRIRPRHFVAQRCGESLSATRLKESDTEFARAMNVPFAEYCAVREQFKSAAKKTTDSQPQDLDGDEFPL